MTTAIDHHLLYDELWIVTASHKLPMLSQERVFTYLSLDKLDGFPNLIHNGSLECDILNDIHLGTNFLVNAFVSDESSTATREEPLRVLAKQQNAGNADVFLSLFVGCYKAIVLP